jgi:hypothetical protein
VVEFLFVELRRGIRDLVLPSQLFPARNAESSECLLDPDALAAKKVSGSFELHLVSAVLQLAASRAISSSTWAEISVAVPPKGDIGRRIGSRPVCLTTPGGFALARIYSLAREPFPELLRAHTRVGALASRANREQRACSVCALQAEAREHATGAA